MVEFALSVGILCTFLFGIIELCIVLFSYNTAAEAARRTARWVATQGIASCSAQNSTCVPTTAQINSYVEAIPGAAQMSATVKFCTNTTTCSSSQANASPGSLVQVQVTETFASIPYVAANGLTVSSTSQMVIWQ